MSDLFRPTKIVTGTRRVPVRPPRTVRPPTSPGQATLPGTITCDSYNSVGGTVDWDLPDNMQSGDLAIAVVLLSNNETLTTPSGWTQENVHVASSVRTYVLYRIIDGTETDPASLTSSGSGGDWVIQTWYLRANSVDFSLTPPESNITNAANGTMNPPSITPSHGSGNYWVFAGGWRTFSWLDSGGTAPTGYTDFNTCELAGEYLMDVNYQLVDITTAEDPGAYGENDGVRGWIGFTIAVKEQPSDTGELAPGDHDHVEADITDLTAHQIDIKNEGTLVGTRGGIDFIAGTDISLSVSDDAGNDDVSVTITSTAGGGGGGGKSYVTEPGMRPPDSADAGDVEFQSHANGTNPATSLFSWGNQGSATAAINNGFLIMNSATTTGLRALLKATPGAGNFEMDTMAQAHQWQDTQWAGLVMLWGTPGTPTAIRAAGFYRNNSVVEDHRFVYTTYNTSWAATADDASQDQVIAGNRVYLRVEWDGTNLIYKTSPNGLIGTFHQVTSQAEGLGRPDYVGLGVNTNGASAAVRAAFSFLRFNWTADFDPTTDD